jgi:glycosyltransferase involved in cell wall biosynthesis
VAHILCLTGSFPGSRFDPGGAFIAAWAEALSARGHTLRVITPAIPNAPAREAWTACVDVSRHRARGPLHGHLWHRFGAPENLRRSARAWLEAPGSVWALRRAAIEHAAEAQLVWSHWAVPFGVIGRSAATTRCVPHVVQLHGSDLRLLERLPLGRQLARHVAADAAHLVFVSNEASERFARLLGPARVPPRTVLPIGVDAPPPGCTAAPPAPGEPWRLLVLSRLIRGKGVDLLLAALPGLPVELTVVGDGPERLALAELARELGVAASFTGACAPSQRWAALARTHALVVPSRGAAREGTPVVIGEALACGVPVIAARSGGIVEALRQGGIIVPADDVTALRAAVQRLFAEPNHWSALARAGQVAAHARSWPTLAADYDALARDVLSRANRSPHRSAAREPRAPDRMLHERRDGAPSPR